LGYDPTLTPEQMLQNGRFTTRELQRNAGDADVSPDGVEHDVACPKGGTKCCSWTPQERLCSCDEFAHSKGFHQIVVRPRVEAKKPVLHCIACGENQHRYVISSRTQFCEQV